MHIDTTLLHPYRNKFIAFGLSTIIAILMFITSYLFTETLGIVLVKSLIGGFVTGLIAYFTRKPLKTHGWSLWEMVLIKDATMLMICFIAIMLCIGLSLWGKELQARNHPESFVQL